MRMSISILLVMVALTVIGCASGDAGNSAETSSNNSDSERQKALDALKSSKTDRTDSERQKAIDWITANCVAKYGIVEKLTKTIDDAIAEKGNIFVILGGDFLKSGKHTKIDWRESRFKANEISEKDVKKQVKGFNKLSLVNGTYDE